MFVGGSVKNGEFEAFDSCDGNFMLEKMSKETSIKKRREMGNFSKIY